MKGNVPFLVSGRNLIVSGRIGNRRTAHQIIALCRNRSGQGKLVPGSVSAVCTGAVLQLPAGQIHRRITGIVQFNKAVAGITVIASAVHLIDQNMRDRYIISPILVIRDSGGCSFLGRNRQPAGKH